MTFKLQQKKSASRTLTVFDVTDDKGSILGRISVPNERAGDLKKHWKEAPMPPAAKANPTAAMARAMLRANNRRRR
jgi:hypothetical protein